MDVLLFFVVIPILVGIISTVVGGLVLYNIQNKNKDKDNSSSSVHLTPVQTNYESPKQTKTNHSSSKQGNTGIFGGSAIGDTAIVILVNAVGCGILFSSSAVGGFPAACAVLIPVVLLDFFWLIHINQ